MVRAVTPSEAVVATTELVGGATPATVGLDCELSDVATPVVAGVVVTVVS